MFFQQTHQRLAKIHWGSQWPASMQLCAFSAGYGANWKCSSSWNSKTVSTYFLMEKTQETVQESEPKATSALFTPCLQAVHQDWTLPLRAHFCWGLEFILHDLVVCKVCSKQVECRSQRSLPCIVHWWLSRYQLFFLLSTTCFLHKCKSLEIKCRIQAFP